MDPKFQGYDQASRASLRDKSVRAPKSPPVVAGSDSFKRRLTKLTVTNLWRPSLRPFRARRLDALGTIGAARRRAVELMVARYRSLDLDGLLAAPRPIRVLFAWSQAGDIDGPRELLAKSTISNTDLVRTLEGMTNLVNSCDIGMYQVLRREILEQFLDYDALNARLIAIGAGDASTYIAQRAGVLLEALENGRRD